MLSRDTLAMFRSSKNVSVGLKAAVVLCVAWLLGAATADAQSWDVLPQTTFDQGPAYAKIFDTEDSATTGRLLVSDLSVGPGADGAITLNGIMVVTSADFTAAAGADFEVPVVLDPSNTMAVTVTAGSFSVEVIAETLVTSQLFASQSFQGEDADPSVDLLQDLAVSNAVLRATGDTSANIYLNDPGLVTPVIDDTACCSATEAMTSVTLLIDDGSETIFNTLEVEFTDPAVDSGNSVTVSIEGDQVQEVGIFPETLFTATDETIVIGLGTEATFPINGTINVTGAGSGTVTLNGTAIAYGGSAVSNMITLDATNTLVVAVTTASTIDVEIIGTDNSMPTITARAPDPDAADDPWLTEASQLTFVCDDDLSGVDELDCPDPLDLAEGLTCILADCALSGCDTCLLATDYVVTDVAGNTADLSDLDAGDPDAIPPEAPASSVGRELRVDTLAPVVDVTAVPDLVTSDQLDGVMITLTVTDASSGVAPSTVLCDGVAATPGTGDEYICSVDLTLPVGDDTGSIPVSIAAADLVGNATSTSVDINVVTPIPVNDSCVVTFQNQRALINPVQDICTGTDCSGTYTMANVPLAAAGPLRLRAVCLSPSVAFNGSDFVDLETADPFQTEVVLFIDAPDLPEALDVSADTTSLSTIGETANLTVEGVDGGTAGPLPDDTAVRFASSNTAVATVDTTGVVTAVATGTAVITARYEGVMSTLDISVGLADDDDGDGMPNDWETENGLDPADPADATEDPDGDTRTSLQEYGDGTDPNAFDTDGDGLSDGDEAGLPTLALVADSDDDGLIDGDEVALGTDPLLEDTDTDGLPDGTEVEIGLDPLLDDTDGNGTLDGDEDTDDDGLTNQEEVDLGTDPGNPDTDGDGIPDGLDDDPLLVETVMPTITMAIAPAGDLIEGQTIVIQAEATDNVAIGKIGFSLNTMQLTDDTAPYELIFTIPYDFNAAELIVAVTAEDVNGNVADAELTETRNVATDPLTTVTGSIADDTGAVVSGADVMLVQGGLEGEFYACTGPLTDFPDIVADCFLDEVKLISAPNFVNPDDHFSTDPFGVDLTEDYAALFSGLIHIHTAGLYTFYLQADDGAALSIDGVLVAETPITGDSTAATAEVELEVGDHDLVIEYFQGTGDVQLQLMVGFGSGASRVVRPAVLLQPTLPTVTTGGGGTWGFGMVPVALGDVRVAATADIGGEPAFGVSPEASPVSGGTTDVGTVVVRVETGDFHQVVTGRGHACAVYDGRYGLRPYCWGRNDQGQLGRRARGAFSETPVYVSSNLPTLSAGAEHTCGLSSAGQAFCWGRADEGQLGDQPRRQGQVVRVEGALVYAQISAGGFHTCALRDTGEALCWGQGTEGQLGDGNFTGGETPVSASRDIAFTSISSGDFHTCGVTTRGEAWCWGEGDNGRLGNGDTVDQGSPVLVGGGLEIEFVSVMAGATHTCGATVNGETWCWGANDLGQLGDGTTIPSSVPVRIDTPALHDARGRGHSCGLSVSGAGYCWGDNASGQLGDGGAITPSLAPSPVSGGLSLSEISTGDDFTCGLTGGGLVFCWGAGGNGQLGNDATDDSSVPVRVDDPPF